VNAGRLAGNCTCSVPGPAPRCLCLAFCGPFTVDRQPSGNDNAGYGGLFAALNQRRGRFDIGNHLGPDGEVSQAPDGTAQVIPSGRPSLGRGKCAVSSAIAVEPADGPEAHPQPIRSTALIVVPRFSSAAVLRGPAGAPEIDTLEIENPRGRERYLGPALTNPEGGRCPVRAVGLCSAFPRADRCGAAQIPGPGRPRWRAGNATGAIDGLATVHLPSGFSPARGRPERLHR
jgi:hypothetical protein